MANGLRIIPDARRSIDSATFTGSLQNLGTPLTYACVLLKFVNNSTVAIDVARNGVVFDFIPANSFALYDVGTNAGSTRGLFMSQNDQFSVSGSAGTGLVYLVSMYTSEF